MKEILKIIKSKRFLWITAILFLCFLESGLYQWLGGPIGIFRNKDSFYELIKCISKVFPVWAHTKQESYELFFSYYGTCTDAVAQFARYFTDNIGMNCYMFSFLIGAFLVPGNDIGKSQKMKKLHPKTLCKKYFASVLITMVLLALLTVLPFLLSFRMEKMGLSGSPMWFWYYLITWNLPTVMITYAMQVLIGMLSESRIVTIIVHLFVMLFMSSAIVTKYPFYKFIIRFNSCSEEFYQSMRGQIIVNRIFISVLAIVLLFAALRICRNKYYKADE